MLKLKTPKILLPLLISPYLQAKVSQPDQDLCKRYPMQVEALPYQGDQTPISSLDDEIVVALLWESYPDDGQQESHLSEDDLDFKVQSIAVAKYWDRLRVSKQKALLDSEEFSPILQRMNLKVRKRNLSLHLPEKKKKVAALIRDKKAAYKKITDEDIVSLLQESSKSRNFKATLKTICQHRSLGLQSNENSKDLEQSISQNNQQKLSEFLFAQIALPEKISFNDSTLTQFIQSLRTLETFDDYVKSERLGILTKFGQNTILAEILQAVSLPAKNHLIQLMTKELDHNRRLITQYLRDLEPIIEYLENHKLEIIAQANKTGVLSPYLSKKQDQSNRGDFKDLLQDETQAQNLGRIKNLFIEFKTLNNLLKAHNQPEDLFSLLESQWAQK